MKAPKNLTGLLPMKGTATPWRVSFGSYGLQLLPGVPGNSTWVLFLSFLTIAASDLHD